MISGDRDVDDFGDETVDEEFGWEESEESDDRLPCPECGDMIYEDSEQCPHCGLYVMPLAHAARSRSWFVLAIVVLVLIGFAIVILS
jgi:predicted RNA-binding Zn-ribbon protein involved in translation (DUF1610 family)